jgi:hypothetical protein
MEARIALLAPEAVGKTTLLVAGIDQFRSRLHDDDYPVDTGLCDPEINGEFQQRAMLIRRKDRPLVERFPKKTTDEAPIELLLASRLKRKSDEILFSVMDFAGGQLWTSISRGAATAQKPLLQALVSCHAHIVLLRADDMADEDIEQCRVFSGASEIYKALSEALDNRTGKERMLAGHPIVFGLTQTDRLLSDEATARSKLQLAISNTKKLFSKFFHQGENYFSLIVGLTMGETISQGGAFKPRNVTLPFDFCLGVCFTGVSQYEGNQAIKVYNNKAELEQRIRTRKDKNFFQRIVDRIDSGVALSDMELYESDLESQALRHKTSNQRIFELGRELWNNMDREAFFLGTAELYQQGKRFVPRNISRDGDALFALEV